MSVCFRNCRCSVGCSQPTQLCHAVSLTGDSRRYTALCFGAIALLSAATPCHSACVLTNRNDGNAKVWIIENDLVTVALRPDPRGTIDDFRLKNNNLITLYPRREVREELVPGTGVLGRPRITPSGCCDALWPDGLHQFNGPYEFKVVEDTPRRITVALSRDTATWKIERELSLADGESALDCKFRLTNKSGDVLERSYWSQCFVRLADSLLAMPGDDSEVWLAPARREENSLQALTKPIKAATIFARTPENIHDQFIAPGQPWMAVMDRTAKLILAEHYDIADFPKDMLFYSWPGDRVVHSMEAMFPRAKYEPGKTIEHRMRLMVLAGIPDVHLVRPGYAVYLAKRPPVRVTSGKVMDFSIGLVSPKAGASVVLRVLVKGERGQTESESLRAEGLSPSKPVFVSTRVSPKSLPPGPYEVWIAEDGGGEHVLLGQTVEIGGD